MIDYPDPESVIGAPFKDQNFKLAVMDDLRTRGIIDLGTPEEFAAFIHGQPVDLNLTGYALCQQCLDYLYRYPLDDDLLAQVRSIYLGGGSEIYNYAYYFWDGESDCFNVHSLEGIERCPNIEEFDDEALSTIDDLTILKGLTRVRKISLSPGHFKGLGTLSDMPCLEEVCLFSQYYSDSDQQILSALEARGVRVKRYA